MCFLPNFLSLIMCCLCFVSYSILINGVPSESFLPSRGISQEDPISPSLFILCAEGLLFVLRATEERGDLMGYHIGQGPTVSHLFFAKVGPQYAAVLIDIFSSYKRLSMQTINLQQKYSYGFERIYIFTITHDRKRWKREVSSLTSYDRSVRVGNIL